MPLRLVNPLIRSLRSRLTMWNTFVVLIAVIAALIGVREGLRYYLIEELDAVLDDEVAELLLVIKEFYPERDKIIAAMHRKTQGHIQAGWHIRWLDEDRKQTIWVSEIFAPDAPLNHLVSSVDGRTVWASETHRSVERRVDFPGIPNFYIRVGSLTEFIDADVARMTRIIAPVGLFIFLLAPAGGYFLADRAIQPLQKIITTTERLRPSHLEERLVTRGVGDELDQLAGKINNFLDQIAEHLTKHREFLANAAHELRSPLAAIQSSVEVTLQKSRSAEDYQELLVSIDEQCHHLAQLVNQVLELAASDAGVTARANVAVRFDEIIRQSCDMFEAVAEERGLRLRMDVPVAITVQGDPSQLRQVITNLIDNAIKFTRSGGTVQVRLEEDRAQQQAVLTVEDSGIGMSAADLPKIFDRFFRADKSRQRGTETRGSGLGLSICNSIVQGHHGQITVRSELNRGTTFRITLPLARR